MKAIQDIYESQNVSPNSKHIEVIASRMIKYVQVQDKGDAIGIFEGDLVDKKKFRKIVSELEKEGKTPPTGKSILQGISKASLSTESFLAAASFQETTRVLTEAAIEGKVDHLVGLKENVIIGGLAPVGTGASKEAPKESEFEEIEGLLEEELEVEEIADTIFGEGKIEGKD